MRLRFLLPVVVLLVAAGTAEAGIRDVFKRKVGHPKPISNVTDRVEKSAGATQGMLVRHPPKQYSGHEWGSRFDQVRNNYPPRPVSPPLRRKEY